MGVRASAPADEGGTRPRPLRGPILDRPASARADDDDGLRLPSAPPPEGRWGGKESSEARLSRPCPLSGGQSRPLSHPAARPMPTLQNPAQATSLGLPK